MELQDTIEKALNDNAPVKTLYIPYQDHFREPWMNVKLSKLNLKCKRLFKKSHLKNDIALYEKYKVYRKTLNRLKLHEKHVFYKELFQKIGKDARTLWSVLNSLIRPM